MAASQLSIYNEALLLCEERLLGSVTEARKPRYLLDQVWNDGGVLACLEEGLWTFATRTISPTFDPNVQPSFGFQHGYQKPTDFIRTAAISAEPYFNDSLTRYSDESGWWWADIQAIFVKYVSKDPNYGFNFDIWPETFKQFVAAHFASKIVKSLTHDKTIQDRVAADRKNTRDSALGKDGMNQPPGFFPRGQLSRARNGMYMGRPGRGDGSGGYY